MAVSILHVLEQGPVIQALGRTAWASVRTKPGAGAPSMPGPWATRIVPPRPLAMIRDYLRHVGADPSAYAGTIPAHLFPHWAFPLSAEVFAGVPYPLVRALNVGCRIEPRAPIPAGDPLHVRARLERIDDDGRRAILVQRIETGTRSVPDALVCETRALVPLRKSKSVRGESRPQRSPRPTIPGDAREIAALDLGARAGFDFAVLTGDFNPIHWIPAAARRAGFEGCILHGFSTLARTMEAVHRALCGGDVARLRAMDVRFVKPITLPTKTRIYVSDDRRLFVGDAGGEPHMEGTFDLS